jgi:hypothetical protein
MALNPYLDFFAKKPRMTGAVIGASAFVGGLYTSPAVIQFALGVGGLMTAFIGTAASIYAGLAITAGISIFAGVLAAMAIHKMFQTKVAQTTLLQSGLQDGHEEHLDSELERRGGSNNDL